MLWTIGLVFGTETPILPQTDAEGSFAIFATLVAGITYAYLLGECIQSVFRPNCRERISGYDSPVAVQFAGTRIKSAMQTHTTRPQALYLGGIGPFINVVLLVGTSYLVAKMRELISRVRR